MTDFEIKPNKITLINEESVLLCRKTCRPDGKNENALFFIGSYIEILIFALNLIYSSSYAFVPCILPFSAKPSISPRHIAPKMR